MAATNVIESPVFVIQHVRKANEDEVDIDDFVASLELDESGRREMADARRWLAVGLGEDLSTLRLRAGFSQAQLAQRVGLRQPNISAIESGKRRPEYETAQKLADVLAVSLEDIYKAWELSKDV